MSNALFQEVFRAPTVGAQDMAQSILSRNGYKPLRAQHYVYGAGDTPLLLVAHTDTVHQVSPRTIHVRDGIASSPEGLGADDRAGVWLIARILASGRRPHVLFTDLEEVGGIGADDAAETLPAPNVRALVQLDRMNSNDAVYYSCRNRGIRKWVDRFGFRESHGSFTDISVLMPSWDIAGVNLSVGYYRQHTLGEYLVLAEADETFRRVCAMVDAPPSRRLRYHRKRRRAPQWREEERPIVHDCPECARYCNCWRDDSDPSSAEYCPVCLRDCQCLWSLYR